MSESVRVVVADDHPVVRDGLTAMLDAHPQLTVVATAVDGLQAVAAATDLAPDVVVMDLRMPHLDGVAAIRRLAVACPDVHVLVLTTYDTDADITRAVEAGATGYLLKDAPAADLVAAVLAASRGETVLAPVVAARLLRHLRTPPQEALTPRELQVLAATARGRTNAQIGQDLFIGESTVKTHLLRVFAKLGVDDRTSAVTQAITRGLLSLPNPAQPPP